MTMAVRPISVGLDIIAGELTCDRVGGYKQNVISVLLISDTNYRNPREHPIRHPNDVFPHKG